MAPGVVSIRWSIVDYFLNSSSLDEMEYETAQSLNKNYQGVTRNRSRSLDNPAGLESNFLIAVLRGGSIAAPDHLMS